MNHLFLSATRKAWGFVLCFVCILLGWSTQAQGYNISGESSLSGVFTLTVFDGDSSSHTYTYKANKGMFLFSGQVESPVLASIQHPSMNKPFYFYIENSEISIALNATRPELSMVKNSRSNSEYRYLMERYRNAAEPNSFLTQWVKEHPNSIYTPWVLHEQMSNIDEGVLRQLITQISGEGRHTFHYTLLRRWMRETPAVSEGSEMPDFAFLNTQKERQTFSQVRNNNGNTLIIFSATWCDRCKTVENQAQRLSESKNMQVLTINIDDNPNGWDAHYLKQLSVDHIPYMIMVDKNGIVQARDLRSWELR